jgi:hypothetical protein
MTGTRRRTAVEDDEVQPVQPARPEAPAPEPVASVADEQGAFGWADAQDHDDEANLHRPDGRHDLQAAHPEDAAAQDAAPQHAEAPAGSGKKKQPLYPRLLRLQHIHPNAWQRAALGEGAVGAGVLLAMADLATAWSILALPVAVAVIVKAHDALQGLLDRGPAPDAG